MVTYRVYCQIGDRKHFSPVEHFRWVDALREAEQLSAAKFSAFVQACPPKKHP